MNIREIDEILEEGYSLKFIAQAYSDIANLKIKRIRAEVERNRIFFEEIAKIYDTVKFFAFKKKLFLKRPKNRLAILITSNYRFYGAINSSLIKYFVGSTAELQDVDKIIIGRAGIDFFKANRILPKYQGLILNTDMPTALELNNLAKYSSNYNQVQVFHSKFKSLLRQQATFTDVTSVSYYLEEHVSDIRHLPLEGATDIRHMPYIFEPDLPKIVNFFDAQILTLLLEETFLESELSRTASRFIRMDQAETEANKFIKEYEKIKAYAKRSLINNAILENFAAMAALRKEQYA